MKLAKISEPRPAPMVLENELPPWVEKRDGKFYNKGTGEELKKRKVDFREFFLNYDRF